MLHPGRDTLTVDETWARVRDRIAELPNGKGREVAWLAEKLETGQQRIFNWTTRGIPGSSLMKVADAIGWKVEQVRGVESPSVEWPFKTISPHRIGALDPMERAMVELAARNELEKIEAAKAEPRKRRADAA